MGKENKKRELISRLPEIYIQLQREYQISAGDFPEVKAMQVLCAQYGGMGVGDRGTATCRPVAGLGGGERSESILRVVTVITGCCV